MNSLADKSNLLEKALRKLDKRNKRAWPLVWMHGDAAMTEAKDLHEELLRALHHLIPRTTYQDSRRLDTLAWAVIGLCLTQMVRLSACAEVVQIRATLAASRVRRFSCWLHHPALSSSHWSRPVIQAALAQVVGWAVYWCVRDLGRKLRVGRGNSCVMGLVGV